MMKSIALAALATVSVLATQAEARTSGHAMRSAGTLTCNIDPGVGLVLGSVRGVDCAYFFYNRRGRLVRESYAGQMSRAGFDVGLTSGQTVSWKVMTSGGRNRGGQLAGAYDGASADASVLVGAGTRALFAPNGKRIALEPVAMSGQVGFGLGFGAAGLDLQKVPTTNLSRLR